MHLVERMYWDWALNILEKDKNIQCREVARYYGLVVLTAKRDRSKGFNTVNPICLDRSSLSKLCSAKIDVYQHYEQSRISLKSVFIMQEVLLPCRKRNIFSRPDDWNELGL